MSGLKAYPVEVVVYIDTDTPLGQIFGRADEATQHKVAVETLRKQLAEGNIGSDTCRMAIKDEDPGYNLAQEAS